MILFEQKLQMGQGSEGPAPFNMKDASAQSYSDIELSVTKIIDNKPKSNNETKNLQNIR